MFVDFFLSSSYVFDFFPSYFTGSDILYNVNKIGNIRHFCLISNFKVNVLKFSCCDVCYRFYLLGEGVNGLVC